MFAFVFGNGTASCSCFTSGNLAHLLTLKAVDLPGIDSLTVENQAWFLIAGVVDSTGRWLKEKTLEKILFA